MPSCPYCSEPVNALKNHVRLSDGGGHGPSGQYPDGFEDDTNGDRGASASASAGASDGPEHAMTDGQTNNEGQTSSGSPGASLDGNSTDGFSITEAEFDEAVQAARQVGYDEGYADGYQEAQQQRSDGTSMAAGSQERRCPECGGDVYDFRKFETGQYHRLNGQRLFVEGDYQCAACREWWIDEPATA